MTEVQRQASAAGQVVTSDEGQGGADLERLPGFRRQRLSLGSQKGNLYLLRKNRNCVIGHQFRALITS